MIELIQNLLESKSYQGGKCSNKKDGFILGVRNGFIIYDLEKAVLNFLKVLNFIELLKKEPLHILFIGSPYGLERLLEKLLANSSHRYMRFSNWIPGTLSNMKDGKTLPDLVITYNPRGFNANSEIMKCGVPIVSFMEVGSNPMFVDFPIFLNLNSEGAKNMFLLLVKTSVTRS